MSVVGLDIGSQTSFCGVARQGKIGFWINILIINGLPDENIYVRVLFKLQNLFSNGLWFIGYEIIS